MEQKDLFDTKTKLENQVITLKGRIFNLDASDCTGELKVIESDDKDLKVNTICKFDFVQNVSEENFLSDIFLKKITIYALKEIYFNPVSLKTEIKKIRIINVRK